MWNILGVSVQAWSRQNAVDALDARVAESTPTCVAFANTNLLNFAVSDVGLRDALADFVVLNDGIGADAAARILYGEAFPCNLNGTDFVPAYLEHTIRSHRIFIIGSRPGIADRAAFALQQRFGAKHALVGCVDGYLGIADLDQVLARIADARASLLLVGMGSPQQEHWIFENMAKSGGTLAFGVGAFLDFASGDISRAPSFIRHLRLEWAYRMALEPRRLFRRYVVEVPIFMLRVIHQRLQQGTPLVHASEVPVHPAKLTGHL